MAKSSAPTFRGLPLPARILIVAVLAAAACLAVFESSTHDVDVDLALLAVLALLCAAGNLFEVFAPANFSFQPNLTIFLTGSLLLPPWAIAVLGVFCFAPGWAIHRFRWYMVAFNLGNYTLAGLAAHEIAEKADAVGTGWSADPITAVGLAGAALAFVIVNHALIALVVTLARGRSLRKSIDDMLDVIPMDIALAMTGACLVALWVFSPSLALLAIAPMALIYRALWVPMLEHKSRTDPKTGLYNSDYLAVQLEDALVSANRHGDGLSVVMIDLDQLRAINNRHGHLAGDRLIRAVADEVNATAAAAGGLAARFGGDELCMLLPVPLRRASELAEELRTRIGRIDLPVDGSPETLRMTVSTGIAAYPEHADTAEGLLGAADAAVYDAKLGGRDRIRLALTQQARETLKIAPPPTHTAAAHAAVPQLAYAPDTSRDAGPALEVPEVNGRPGDDPDAASAEPEAPAAAHPLTVKAYVWLLCGAAAVVGALSNHDAIPASPWLFVLLVAAVVMLDAVRIDVFERANLSPAAVPELALAYFFGPLGPIAAEGAIALLRALRREPALKWGFDLGALSLAGAAAAAVYHAFPEAQDAALLLVSALAGTAYYAVNSALLAIVMGLSESRSPAAVWRERLAWMSAHYVVFGLVAGTFVISELDLGLYAVAVFALPLLMLWVAEKQYLDRSRSTVTELRATNDELGRANARLLGLLEDNQQLLGRMHRSYISTITSLARTVEAKDPLTSGHTERVAEIALLLAEELGFDESQLPAVRVGAIIHDIGKIGIPDQILLKPGPLDPEELAVMRTHPELSSYIVAELELPAVVKQMVRSHHERYDGAGYPDGLSGEEIPLAARILSVADALDAMTSDRPYRKALPLDVATAEIKAKSGSQFCPKVAAALPTAMARRPDLWAETAPEGADPALARVSSA